MKLLPFKEQNLSEITETIKQLEKQYAEYKALNLNLNLTRGKPDSNQLDLSNELLHLPDKATTSSGIDVRNYGDLQGIAEIRDIFSTLYNVRPENLLAGNNSSTQLLNTVLEFLMLFGDKFGNETTLPWVKQEKIKFICPVPGYDRHFSMLEHFGIEMINVPLQEDGPDVEKIKTLVQDDETIKGMIIVPIFSNPTGTTYSLEKITELLSMPTAAKDFKILIDNAYGIHTLTDNFPEIPEYLEIAQQAGYAQRPLVLFSTSKITFAGSGIAFLAANPDTLDWFLQHYGLQTIGPDKVNQLAHAIFLESPEKTKKLMLKQKNLIKPKFDLCLQILTENLADTGVIEWNNPQGGYFITVKAYPGTAKKVVELAKQAGIALTPAGSTFPYCKDPEDTYLRLAPTYASLDDIKTGMQIVTNCLALAAANKLEENINSK